MIITVGIAISGYIVSNKSGNNISRVEIEHSSSYNVQSGPCNQQLDRLFKNRLKKQNNNNCGNTYLEAQIQHCAKANCVGHSKECERENQYDPHAGALVNGGKEEDAATTDSLGLGAEALQPQDLEAISIVHDQNRSAVGLSVLMRINLSVSSFVLFEQINLHRLLAALDNSIIATYLISDLISSVDSGVDFNNRSRILVYNLLIKVTLF